MFDFHYSQDAGDNRCGGYSLAAIATNLRPNAFHDPINVYSDLRDTQVNNFQNNILNAGRDSRDLVAYTHQGGTDILLPSTFFAAQYAQLNYEAYLNRTTYVREATPDLPGNINADDIVDEEIAKINTLQGAPLHLLTMGPNDIGPSLEDFLQEDFNNNQHRYWLVLVLGGRHWVAIERGPNGGYCIYNPDGGINAVVGINDDEITYTDSHNIAHTDNWSGIAISVA